MKNATLETSVGVFVLIGIACIGYMTIKLGKMEIVGDNRYAVYARFESVAGLANGADVQMAGVSIGRVSTISLDQEKQVAVVTLEVKKDIRLTEDVIASIKTAGLIGDKYIMLTPGGSDVALKPGDTIIETESALDLEDLISKYAFDDI
ncbi:MAG: outer membrane lipid asymmetry maintenance protein MlaD [Deltaproteobacteria bacterium]|nr:outer membrane lipid asymmetry maintenance protein MlaD [Deltaproteobacteria bacterium]